MLIIIIYKPSVIHNNMLCYPFLDISGSKAKDNLGMHLLLVSSSTKSQSAVKVFSLAALQGYMNDSGHDRQNSLLCKILS